MKANNTLTIFVTPLKGEEIRIEKACTLKQAVALAKKEARKMIRADKGNAVVMINILGRSIYDTIETLAHIEAMPKGRRVAFSDEQPAETYAVCWGDEYKEEDGESNAIATTTSESDAKEIALNESRANGCTMSVVRMSDKTVILLLSDEVKLTNESAAAYNALCSSFVDTYTPTTTEPTTNTPEFSELSHAGQCLDIYLHNTAEIYNRYTVPAIAAIVEAVRRNGWQLPKDEAIKNLTFWTSWQPGTKKALQAAARLVRKYDRLTPTAQDIEQVTRNYAAYIVDCAKYEIETA